MANGRRGTRSLKQAGSAGVQTPAPIVCLSGFGNVGFTFSDLHGKESWKRGSACKPGQTLSILQLLYSCTPASDFFLPIFVLK